MGSIKDRNGMDVTEAEDIKKRWQEYTEELFKKDLHNPHNHDVVITHTHLKPDILECEVKWALGSITENKASGGYNSSWAISNPKRLFCESTALIVHPKGDQSWVFTGRTDVEAETPILWPSDKKS